MDTGKCIGNFDSVDMLCAYSEPLENNDYAYVNFKELSKNKKIVILYHQRYRFRENCWFFDGQQVFGRPKTKEEKDIPAVQFDGVREVVTGTLRGFFGSIDELNAYKGEVFDNDYAVVRIDEVSKKKKKTIVKKYRWIGSAWMFVSENVIFENKNKKTIKEFFFLEKSY